MAAVGRQHQSQTRLMLLLFGQDDQWDTHFRELK